MESIPENIDDIEEEMKDVYKKLIVRKPARTNYFEDVPDCILHDILVKVPSKDLFKNARLVCRKWRQMISTAHFISKSFHRETDELLIGTRSCRFKDHLHFKVKQMEISQQLECILHNFGLSRLGRIRSSCNGLMLVNHPKKKGVLQVMNTVTKIGLTLPKCPSGCPHKACGSALGFDPISNVYKVVHIYADAFGFEIANLISLELSWRRIPGPWEALHDRPFNIASFVWCEPVSVNNGRYVHWFVDSNQYIISMDINRETFIRTDLPYVKQNIETDRYNLIELGGFLGFTHKSSDCQLDVWILEDLTKQSWSKKHSITTELVNYVVSENHGSCREFDIVLPKMNKLVVVASLNDGKVLVLKHDSCLYLYDMDSRVMKKLKITMNKDVFFIAHRSSLLHWNQVDRDCLFA